MNQRGFTLVELTLALAIMTFMTLALASGILNFYQIYQNGLSSRTTQENARSIADTITSDGRSKTGYMFGPALAGQWNMRPLCLLSASEASGVVSVIMYDFNSSGELVRKIIPNQPGSFACINNTAGTNERVLSAQGTRIVRFTDIGADPGVLGVNMTVASINGIDGVDANGRCATADNSQWCSATNLAVTVNMVKRNE